jgi:hypothetical protein
MGQGRTEVTVVTSAFVGVLADLALLATVASVSRRAARIRHAWQLRAWVVEVKPSAIRVRHESGQSGILMIDRHTRYIRNAAAAVPDLVQVGTHVMVDVEREGNHDRAMTIEII